jgi:hypothetical protein
MMVAVVVGYRIAENARSGRASDRKARIHRLHGPPRGVVGGHAAHARADADQQGGNPEYSGNDGISLHMGNDVPDCGLFNSLFNMPDLFAGIKPAGSCRWP